VNISNKLKVAITHFPVLYIYNAARIMVSSMKPAVLHIAVQVTVC